MPSPLEAYKEESATQYFTVELEDRWIQIPETLFLPNYRQVFSGMNSN